MDSKYDLTTVQGLNAAMKSNPMLTLSLMSMTGFNPIMFNLIGKGVARVMDLFDSKVLCEAQTQAASELIKAGKENGVKKMKITLDQEAGLNFEAPIKGVNIRTMAGSKGKMTIEVEYK